MTKFRTAIIDPPWPYARVSSHPKMSGFAEQKYKLLSIDDLKALPVGTFVGGYVFMWTVGPFLKEGIELLEAWGIRLRNADVLAQKYRSRRWLLVPRRS